MEPRVVTQPAIMIVGIGVRTTNAEEMTPATARIPGLWQRFFQEGIGDEIPNRSPTDALFGIYTEYESDFTGPYSLIVGSEVTSLASIPSRMTGLTLPAGNYVVFTAQGPMPQALIETWGRIWTHFSSGANRERAYTVDYERHYSGDRADIYIAAK